MAESDAHYFQNAFDQQQTFWGRKLVADEEFSRKINECAAMQTWMNKAINDNKLSVEAIRSVSSGCATEFLRAIGYIRIVETDSGNSIQWTDELIDGFKDGGEWYRLSSTKQFWLGQIGSIAMSGGNVLLEASRPVLSGTIVDRIKLGLKAAQFTWQLAVTPYAPIAAGHEQHKNVKGQELAGIPYMPNVSSIDYKAPVKLENGTTKICTFPYPDAGEVRWSLDLIKEVNEACDPAYRAINAEQKLTELKNLKTELENQVRPSTTGRLSKAKRHKLVLAEQRLALVELAIRRMTSRYQNVPKTDFAKAEGNLKKDLARAEISATFNSAPAQSKVRAARYGIFATQAAITIAGASARLGHCIPRPATEAASSIAANVTWAGSEIATMLVNNGTETENLIAECAGFNPWGFTLEVINFGLALSNPIRYAWNLPQACADDHMRKVIAYTAALMLQPDGQLTDGNRPVAPEVFTSMLRGRMWRVLDCAAKTLESDLNSPASALMTHIVGVATIPGDEEHAYKYLFLKFKELQDPVSRRHFMESIFFSKGSQTPAAVGFLLQHYEQIVDAMQLIRSGKIEQLLEESLLPRESLLLLRSGLTIAAGGAVTEDDEQNWKTLMRIFGDTEARNKKTDQETQKTGQGLAKRGFAGAAGFTLIKSFIDLSAAISKSQSSFEHDIADIVSKGIQILGGLVASGSAFTGYFVSFCYWQFILEKNRQRQSKLTDKFSPPNSSILDPYATSFLRRPNLDRQNGVVRKFGTLLAHPVHDSLINKKVDLTYSTKESTFWSDTWAQINAIDFNLDLHHLRERLSAIVHPDETLLDSHVDELKEIIQSNRWNLVEELDAHIAAQKSGAPPSTTTVLTDVLVENERIRGEMAIDDSD